MKVTRTWPGQRHKYGVAAKEDRTLNGVVFHSKAEARFAFDLDRLKDAGEIQSYDLQVRYPLVVNGAKVGAYVGDFLVLHSAGHRELIEVKGAWTATAKLKWKIFLALYADEFRERGDWITVVMARNGKEITLPTVR